MTNFKKDPKTIYTYLVNKHRIDLSISRREAEMLAYLMTKDGWTNVSGFVKSKLFEEAGFTYEKVLKEAAPKDIASIAAGIMQNLSDRMAYFEACMDEIMAYYKNCEPVNLATTIRLQEKLDDIKANTQEASDEFNLIMHLTGYGKKAPQAQEIPAEKQAARTPKTEAAAGPAESGPGKHTFYCSDPKELEKARLFLEELHRKEKEKEQQE